MVTERTPRRLFRYWGIFPHELTASDLLQVRQDANESDGPLEAYQIEVWEANSAYPEKEEAQALYFPRFGRLGIAWGAESTWADVGDLGLERGIELWLNDREAWNARN